MSSTLKVLSTLLRPIAHLIVLIFYRRAKYADPLKVVASVFVTQKILGFNRCVGWPTHHTSRIINPRNITVGNRSFPGWSQGCYIQAKNGIVIGNNLRMGPNVGLISANHDENDYDCWPEESPIRIGDNVWIGMGAIIMPGVNIGNNVVIGANSVVNCDIPNDKIAAGTPAKIIRDKKPYKGKKY